MASFNNDGGNHARNNNNNSNSNLAAGSGTLQALRPQVVDRYWNDIAEHFREPGFSTFDKEKSSRAVIQDPEFMRKLLLAVITDRPGQGDIVPSVIAKSCCDFFSSLDQAGKTNFLRLLARDFGKYQASLKFVVSFYFYRLFYRLFYRFLTLPHLFLYVWKYDDHRCFARGCRQSS